MRQYSKILEHVAKTIPFTKFFYLQHFRSVGYMEVILMAGMALGHLSHQNLILLQEYEV